MEIAFWISLTLVSLISASVLKGVVRLTSKGTDNGWDNALTYVAITVLLITYPIKWMFGTHSWLIWSLIPPVLWTAQFFTLKWVYEVSPQKAMLIGVAHTIVASVINCLVAIAAGVVAAYILYGKIISDPILVLKFLLRLIGIELPFDQA